MIRPFAYVSSVNWGFHFVSFHDGQFILYIGRLGMGLTR